MSKGSTNVDIERIIEVALRAPSGDNCQPFRFVYHRANQRLDVYHLPEVAQHILNYRNLASLISAGMLCHLIDLAAQEQRLEIACEEFLSAIHSSEAVFLRIYLRKKAHAVETENHVLVQVRAAESRTTFRGRSFRAPTEKIKRLENLFKERSSKYFERKILAQPRSSLIATLFAAEQIIWTSKKVTRDIFKWVHLFKRPYMHAKTGLYWRELGISFLEWPVLFLLKHFSSLARALIKLGARLKLRRDFSRQLQNSSLICFFGTKINSRTLKEEEVFEFGKFAMADWLAGTSEGLCLQPLSLQIFPKLFGATTALWCDCEESGLDLEVIYNNIHNQLRNEFNLPEDSQILWLFRLGLAPQKPHRAQLSLRKNVSDVLSIC